MSGIAVVEMAGVILTPKDASTSRFVLEDGVKVASDLTDKSKGSAESAATSS